MTTRARPEQQDLFVIDLADVAPRDDLASMEHPLFSLTPNPDGRSLVYETPNTKVEIVPSGKGLPTIFDKDILIFCISRLMDAKNRGEKISKRLQFSAHDLLLSTRRRTGGAEYTRLREAFTRLQGTQFITDIQTGGKGETRMFSMFDEAGFHFDMSGKKMRVSHCEVVLSDWVMRSIEANEVVQIAPEYFDLRRPLDRRLYEIARKHCGKQSAFEIGLDKLQAKTGSNTAQKQFRRYIREAIKRDNLPFYRLELDERDKVTFRPRKPMVNVAKEIRLSQDTLERGHGILKDKGWDSQTKAREWQAYAAKNPPNNPDGAFIGWCNKQRDLRR